MKKYRRNNKNPYAGRMLSTNNSRRRAGLPTLRKHDRRKRYFTRCEIAETVEAFLNFCENTELKF